MKTKLTKRYIDSNTDSQGKWSPPPDEDLFIRDTGLAGFGIKITPSGTVSYIYENNIKGRGSKRTTLGRYPSLPFTDAKNEALDTSKLYRSGIDPRDLEKQKATERAKEKARDITLQSVMDDYFTFREETTKTEYTKVIKNQYGDFLAKPVRNLSEKDITVVYMDKVNQGHMPQAQKGLRYLKAILNHGMKMKIEGAPVLSENAVVMAEAMIPKKDRKPIPAKEGYIEPNDIFKFIRAIITTCHMDARDLLLMLLFTGLRDGEAKGLKWEDVNFEKKTFTVRNTKGKKDHTLPMGPFLYAMLLSRYQADDRHSVYVFPNPKRTGRIGDIRKQMDKVRKKSGIKFSPQDLRRTYPTLLEQELGASHRVATRLLNHAPKGVTEKHYLKTKATSYDPLVTQFYVYVIGNHDWSDDDGKNRITRKWVDDNQGENPYQRNNLSLKLYGDQIQALLDKSPELVDMIYLSEANPDIVDCFDGIPDELKNRIFMGAEAYAEHCEAKGIENKY
jgi:integrase